jgi:DNA-directed RNA polymerase specialized sigma24 family protein
LIEETLEVLFEEFVRTIGERVRRALVAFYGVEIGTEAAAEAMRVAWERWPDVSSMDNPGGYLFRVGQSQARPNVRWARHRTTFPSTATAATQPDYTELIDLFAALTRLRPIQRAALVLVRCHGLTYGEAATVLGINESAVTNHVHRGTRRLREILEVTP